VPLLNRLRPYSDSWDITVKADLMQTMHGIGVHELVVNHAAVHDVSVNDVAVHSVHNT
jgi:hypothetical protein